MANLVLKNNTAANDVSLEFNRGSNASWRIVNSSGTLYMRCNYTSSASDYYDALSLAYNSGNLWVKGRISAPSLTLSSTTDGSQTAASNPALRIGDSDSAIHIIIDRNTINAKATSTTAGTLHLNESGGLVKIGSGGLTVTGNITGTLVGNADTSTQFSSARTIALTGDVTGSVSSTGANGWSITTAVGANNHVHDASATWNNRALTISVGGGGAAATADIPATLTGFTNISSTKFTGALVGNADTATQFASATTVALTGAVTGTSSASTRGWSIATSIARGVAWDNRKLTITVGNGTANGSIPTTLTGFVSITSQTLIATTKITIPVKASSYTSTTAGEIWIVA